jgi:hypothetical protein
MTGNADSTHSQFLDRFVQLLGRHFRMLQRDRRQADKPIRMSGTPLREPFVLDFDELPRQIAIRAVPPAALVTQNLNVDALLVQSLDPCGPENKPTIHVVTDVAGEIGSLDDVEFLRRDEVPMHIHNFDAPLPDEYFTTFGRRSLTDAYRKQSGRNASGVAKEIPAIWHG